LIDKTTQVLNKGWEFYHDGNTSWQRATVPGCIHLDLLDNQVIPDPFAGKNEKDLQWISARDWEYRMIFTPTEPVWQKKVKRLIFHGLDTYATVFLNGKPIIQANNMFRSWEADISELLIHGENELNVTFRSPLLEIRSKMEELDYQLPADNDQTGGTSPFTRKAPYHFGWDWGPTFVTAGIWQNVDLLAWNSWCIRNMSLIPVQCDPKTASLKLEARVESSIHTPGSVIISEAKLGILMEADLSITIGENPFVWNLEIPNPELWWPAGHGAQPLYNFTITIKAGGVEDSASQRTGLRSVRVEREQDKRGESFAIHVNGKPIFAKGANWIPADSFTPRLTPGDYQGLLTSAVKANMNTVRVWGGGIYEPDHFYELCDELGLLVWQDFMFACSMYPADDTFLDSIHKEASYQVNRLKHHPSIVLWCGNNEVASAWLSWGWQEGLPDSVWEQDYRVIFHEVLPKICASQDPSRLYWPTSPGRSTGFPELDQAPESGDMHYWGVWHGGDGFEAFNENVGRFMSEYGMQSFPDLRTVEMFADRDQWDLESDVIKAHQKASLGNKNLMKYLNMYYQPAKDFKSLVTLSQIMQAEAIQIAVESHRRKMPYCMGSLYWQLNDCWPAISWSSLDYLGNWKALHYAARRFFEPILISTEEIDNQVKVYIINDRDEHLTAELGINLYTFDGTICSQIKQVVDVPPASSVIGVDVQRDSLISTHDVSELGLVCTLEKDQKQIARNHYFFAKPKDLRLGRARFDFTVEFDSGKYILSIHAKTFLYKLHLTCPSYRGIFSDNYFEMLPDETVKIEFDPTENIDSRSNPPKFSIKSLVELLD
jgi:beta-mannosidase